MLRKVDLVPCFACSRDSESREPCGALVILLILVAIHNFVKTWRD
jgi:hypothetical protein